jgi:4-amino-4-deoxy-L-arabinose transferase-like glycosyltransferase
VTSPNPALVSQREVQRLPRLALLLFCAAYVLPGLFGRDPWKGADQAAFGYMLNIAQGKTSWIAPLVGGLPVDTAVLPHWLGALFIALLSPVMDAALAARFAFAGLLTLTLVLTWYTTFHLARTEAAQPLPFAFGGEAKAVDYARALADGALLALIASLGLLQLGHETTPELVQLFAVSLLLWGLSAAAFRRRRAQYAVLLSLPLLAASGAPAMALGMGLVGTWLHLVRPAGSPRGFWHWVAAGTLLSALAAALLHTWALRWYFQPDFTQLKQLLRLFLWFLWPAWALALWTIWRWRKHLRQTHLALPLGMVLVAMCSCVAMGGSDRALMLALPALAVLAAFALPTLQRSTSAAIDWFSVFFFTVCAATMWVVYVAVQTGVPAKPAANVARLAPDFKAVFSPLELAVAILGTLAWLWLVRWRTGRHRQAMWKSLVLPASGVALCWLLLMTLWLPLLDHGRSYRQWVGRVARHVAPNECLAAPGLTRSQLAALEDFGGLRVDGRFESTRGNCPLLLLPGIQDTPAGWRLLGRERRIRDKDEVVSVYRRIGP